MATMSRGSSTTQSRCGSRRSSAHTGHSSPSERLKQRVQNDTRSRASTMAWARRTASAFGIFRRWNAMRWADFGPMPGNRPNSSMSSWTDAEYTDARSVVLVAGLEQAAEATAEAAHRLLHLGSAEQPAEIEPAHRRLLGLVHLADGVVQRGEHEVLEEARVVGVDDARVDAHRAEVEPAGDRHDDRAAAGRPLDDRVRRLGLRGEELLLHLLGLGEQPAEVERLLRARIVVGHGVLLCRD